MIEWVLIGVTALTIAAAPYVEYEVPEAHAARSNCTSCHSQEYLDTNASLTLEFFDD